MPQHPTADDRDPHAFFEPGVQFWPGVVESASPTVEFLVEAKESQSPGDHTVSPASVDFGDGGHATVTGEQRIVHTFAEPGRYTVTATVTDEQGQRRTWSRPVTIDPPPAATVTRHGNTLIAGVSGGDGHAIAAHWRFSDGSFRAHGSRLAKSR